MEIIAIDGLAGTGKSTVSKELARRLDLNYLDTGATFRMVALSALEQRIELSQTAEVLNMAKQLEFTFEDGRSFIGSRDVSGLIRSDEVSAAASRVAIQGDLRSLLMQWQRDWATAHGSSVVEGRDITSVVFPDAAVKIYLIADANVRAVRRFESNPENINERDTRDSSRSVAPLIRVEDAFTIDTTYLSVKEVEDMIVSLWANRNHP